MATCPGSGRYWISGTGCPICPVCHRGPNALGAKRPIIRFTRGGVHWTGRVPEHQEWCPDCGCNRWQLCTCAVECARTTHRKNIGV